MTTVELGVDALREALAKGEFVFHYQPKVSMVHGGVCGAEALLRWRRPDGSLVQPAAFIPLAERTGFITEITLGMLRSFAADLAIVRAHDPGLVLSFNTSAQDFEDDRLVQSLAALIDCGALARDSAEIELTECTVLTAGEAGIARLSRLRQLGLLLAMDDFGTGYSSIDTLSRLPFTTLKIDQGVVMRMAASDKDATIAEESIRMGHRLGLEIVAEGIESEATFLKLQSAGCSVAQGYWIGRPEPLDGFLRFLGTGRHWPAGSLGLLHMVTLDHVAWRKVLLDALVQRQGLDAPLPDTTLSRFAVGHADCRLGRWYHAAGRQLAHERAYGDIAAPHEALHACGKRIVRAAQDGATLAEIEPLLGELTAHSTRIIGHLQELEHAVLRRLIDVERARADASARLVDSVVPASVS